MKPNKIYPEFIKRLIIKLFKIKINAKIVFFIVGIVSTLWFIIRVVSKPQRAGYPCMKAAFPFASSFILYLISIGSVSLLFKKAIQRLNEKKFYLTSLFVILAITALISSLLFNNHSKISAKGILKAQIANSPIGTGRGIFPARVVWMYSPRATDENCIPNSETSPWWSMENNNQANIDSMLSIGVRLLTNTPNDTIAWNAIFRFHNRSVGKGDNGYSNVEKIFIKINATSSWNGNYNPDDFSQVFGSYYGISETSPQLILALLRQLVNVAGVPQTNIYVGDPMKHIYQSHYILWSSEFPDVHYLDNNSTYDGREIATKSTTAKIKYSDKGSVLSVTQDNLYKIYYDMEYMLNVPTMKGHKFAGVTMFAKNHFGSQTRFDASHMHDGLVRTDEYDTRRPGYGLYRVQVDLMEHDLLGKRNLFFLMDALYTSDMEIANPIKWQMVPFNDDWTSSIFLSFDNVAIESVGYDFLSSEFNDYDDWPQMSGTDDYLEQAADSAKWPDGIKYDPNGNKTYIASLGVHEHWNNPDDKKYSRNLNTGNGIELLYAHVDTLIKNNYIDTIGLHQPQIPNSICAISNNYIKLIAYPNPFSDNLNIKISVKENVYVNVQLTDMQGRLIYNSGKYIISGDNTIRISSNEFNYSNTKGLFIVSINIKSKNISLIKTFKVLKR